MLIDIIVLVLLLLAAFKGLRNGLILALFSFLAFVVGLAAAIKLSAVAAGYIGSAVNVSQRWLPVLGNLLTRKMEARLASQWGWHLWIYATK